MSSHASYSLHCTAGTTTMSENCLVLKVVVFGPRRDWTKHWAKKYGIAGRCPDRSTQAASRTTNSSVRHGNPLPNARIFGRIVSKAIVIRPGASKRASMSFFPSQIFWFVSVRKTATGKIERCTPKLMPRPLFFREFPSYTADISSVMVSAGGGAYASLAHYSCSRLYTKYYMQNILQHWIPGSGWNWLVIVAIIEAQQYLCVQIHKV